VAPAQGSGAPAPACGKGSDGFFCGAAIELRMDEFVTARTRR
jgi:hypothetical protein